MPASPIRPEDARARLEAAGVFDALSAFDPRFVGSIPLDVHGPEADADIACGALGFDAFKSALNRFAERPGFERVDNIHAGEPSVICRFRLSDLPVEVYGRARPVETHESFVHWLAEDRLLKRGGERLRADVRAAKAAGLKTEPAFAACLKLGGDPFVELLKLASPSDAALRQVLANAGYP